MRPSRSHGDLALLYDVDPCCARHVLADDLMDAPCRLNERRDSGAATLAIALSAAAQSSAIRPPRKNAGS